MAIRLAEFPELLGLFYEGVADAGAWRGFLEELCRKLDCDKAGLICARHDSNPVMAVTLGISEEFIKAFNTYYGKISQATLVGARAALRDGYWQSINEVTRFPKYENNEYYAEFLRPQGIFYEGVSIVRSGTSHLASVNFSRPKSAGLMGADAARFIELFTPHMARAFQIQAKLDTLRTAAEGTSAALDRWDTGLIALDRHARVVSMNAAAEAIVKSQRSLVIRYDTVTALDNAQQSQLNKLIDESVRTGDGLGTGDGGAMQLWGKDSTPISIVVTPFRSNRLFAESRPCALLFIVDPSAKPLTRITVLRVLYGLTPAECRLASLLLEGFDLETVAEHLRVTAGTARFMLKQVFHKTSTHRQSQLIRLLSSLPGESNRP